MKTMNSSPRTPPDPAPSPDPLAGLMVTYATRDGTIHTEPLALAGREPVLVRNDLHPPALVSITDLPLLGDIEAMVTWDVSRGRRETAERAVRVVLSLDEHEDEGGTGGDRK